MEKENYTIIAYGAMNAYDDSCSTDIDRIDLPFVQTKIRQYLSATFSVEKRIQVLEPLQIALEKAVNKTAGYIRVSPRQRSRRR